MRALRSAEFGGLSSRSWCSLVTMLLDQNKTGRPPAALFRFVDGRVKPGHGVVEFTNTPSLSHTYRTSCRCRSAPARNARIRRTFRLHSPWPSPRRGVRPLTGRPVRGRHRPCSIATLPASRSATDRAGLPASARLRLRRCRCCARSRRATPSR
jgi:hypothetical protein